MSWDYAPHYGVPPLDVDPTYYEDSLAATYFGNFLRIPNVAETDVARAFVSYREFIAGTLTLEAYCDGMEMLRAPYVERARAEYNAKRDREINAMIVGSYLGR